MGKIDDAADDMKDAADRAAKAEKHAIDRAADQAKEDAKNTGEALKDAGGTEEERRADQGRGVARSAARAPLRMWPIA